MPIAGRIVIIEQPDKTVIIDTEKNTIQEKIKKPTTKK